jgi:O-antigen/teichoic acid export membrane protein
MIPDLLRDGLLAARCATGVRQNPKPNSHFQLVCNRPLVKSCSGFSSCWPLLGHKQCPACSAKLQAVDCNWWGQRQRVYHMNMIVSARSLLKGTVWTIGAYGLGQVLRLITNVFLARLLAPELFGIMLIVNSLRTGIELLSDVGIRQNIVYHANGNDPDFYNTAWSIQAVRSVLLWLVALSIAVPVAQFYQSADLIFILPLTAFSMIFAGFTSVSLSLLQKRQQIAKINAFEVITSVISSGAYVLFAYLNPTIWALVLGGLFGSAVTMIGSYFLLPDVTQRFQFSKRFSSEILHFGKWIFVSSILYFLSTNFDRLYFAKAVPLQLLGIYGIARSISELLGLVVWRLGNYVLFPLIASHSHIARDDLRKQLTPLRAKFLLVTAIFVSLFVATADIPIKLLYDQRYQAANWMLPILTIGSWFSIVAYLNESTLLGLGRPSFNAASNGFKFVFLLIGLPLSLEAAGLVGCMVVVVLADLFRYIPIFVGQRQERFSFRAQDFLITLLVFLLIGLWEWVRWILEYGTSFDSLPIEMGSLFGAGR